MDKSSISNLYQHWKIIIDNDWDDTNKNSNDTRSRDYKNKVKLTIQFEHVIAEDKE